MLPPKTSFILTLILLYNNQGVQSILNLLNHLQRNIETFFVPIVAQAYHIKEFAAIIKFHMILKICI